MYIETSSPRAYGDNAKLDFSVSSSDIGELSCLKFYYHMYGYSVNTLHVYNGNTRVFTKSGDHGNHWLKAKITVTLGSKVSRICFCFISSGAYDLQYVQQGKGRLNKNEIINQEKAF